LFLADSPLKAGEPETKLASAVDRWSDGGKGGTPDFSRHVVPLMGKLGCNNRACHGSFQGQNGFRLSLFGHDGKMDYAELTKDEGDGPRVNVKSPAESLILAKATSDEIHEGGKRMEKGSWQYRIFHEWIAAGANYDPDQILPLERLEITPAEVELSKSAAGTQQLRLVAHFADGSREDVTPLTLFSTNDDAVANVSDEGLISVAGFGDTAIVAVYAGVVVTSQVIVPHETSEPFPAYPANNPIDDLVAAKLKKVKIHPSDLASDEVFLRRVYLDLIGTLPTAAEAREFLASKEGDKRARLIDALLQRPEYAMYWATRFSDWTGNDSRFTPQPRSKTAWLWYDWLRDKLDRNVAYDEIVGGFITATSREGRPLEEYLEEHRAVSENLDEGFDDGTYARRRTNDMFWRKAGNNNAQTAGLQLAYAFLGVRLECAQCHKHPFDRWTQYDFQQYTAFFSVLGRGVQKDVPKEATKTKDRNALPLQEIFVTTMAAEVDAKGKKSKDKEKPLKIKAAKLLGGDRVPFEQNEDPREKLWQWMRSPENPYLAPAIANRLWGHYFGRGIVNPVDDFNAANPPSNPQLLDWLAKDFIKHKFDLKHLHRTILNSRTYQLSWIPNESNQLDERNFSHALLRRMPAEVVLDAINQVNGATDRYSPNDAPAGTRAIGLAPSRLRGNGPEYALSIFGRPLRTQTCDCERSGETGLAQALYLLNDTELNSKIGDQKGRLAELVDEVADDKQLIEELYLSTLSRHPREDEMQKSLEFVAAAQDRTAGMQDVLWSLLNVREFVFVH
jgi:hypothetical protein